MTFFLWYYMIGCVILTYALFKTPESEKEKKNTEEVKDLFQQVPHIVILTFIIGAAFWLPIFLYFAIFGVPNDNTGS